MCKIETFVRDKLPLYGRAGEAMPAKPAMLQFLNLTRVYLVSTDRKYIRPFRKEVPNTYIFHFR